MTVVKTNDAFTYKSARGDNDIARPAELVGVVNADGSALSSSLGSTIDIRLEVEVLRSVDTKLGALLILLTNAFGAADKPEAYLEAAEKDLRSTSN